MELLKKLWLVPLFCFSVLAASCGSETEDEPEFNNSIVGTWTYSASTEMGAYQWTSISTFIFNPDGTGRQTSELMGTSPETGPYYSLDEDNGFTYSYNKQMLSIRYNGDDETITLKATVERDELTLYGFTNETITFLRKK